MKRTIVLALVLGAALCIGACTSGEDASGTTGTTETGGAATTATAAANCASCGMALAEGNSNVTKEVNGESKTFCSQGCADKVN